MVLTELGFGNCHYVLLQKVKLLKKESCLSVKNQDSKELILIANHQIRVSKLAELKVFDRCNVLLTPLNKDIK